MSPTWKEINAVLACFNDLKSWDILSLSYTPAPSLTLIKHVLHLCMLSLSLILIELVLHPCVLSLSLVLHPCARSLSHTSSYSTPLHTLSLSHTCRSVLQPCALLSLTLEFVLHPCVLSLSLSLSLSLIFIISSLCCSHTTQ